MAGSPPTRELSVSDLTGSKVGRFEVTRRLGAGGMGEVYLATDSRLKRTVVLKRLAPHLRADTRYRERLVKEAERASRLDLQHIAAIYDVIEDNGEVLIVMEHVEGSDLRHAALNPNNIQEILSIAVQCAQALAAAHAVGVLHRDIKPENIMLKPDRAVKVLDFGLAREMSYGGPQDETALTASVETKAPAGTAGYVAPEVLLEQNVDARSDIFSLGVVFYELLTRRHPFRTESFVGTCDRVLHHEPRPLREANPSVPPELERIVHKMLAKDRDERYATVADLLADLRALVRHGTSAAFLPPAMAARPQRRVRWYSWAAAVVLVAALAAGVWMKIRPGAGLGGGTALPGQKHIAVLPFRVVGDTKGMALGQGLAETLTAKLASLSTRADLQVVPSADVYGRKVSKAEDARREFGANLVIDGSMQQVGGQVRIAFGVIDTIGGRQVRGDAITSAIDDVFALEDKVVASVLSMLEVELERGAQQQAMAVKPTANQEAYSGYLEALGLLREYDKPENVDAAVAKLRKTIDLDPNFAAAYAALGQAFHLKYQASKDPAALVGMRTNCGRAASLDGRSPGAHLCLGSLAQITGQYDTAVREFQAALAAEPTSDSAYRGLARAYESLGKPQEAETTYRQSIALRPHYWAGYSWLGAFLGSQSRFQEAAEMFRMVVNIAPENVRGWYNLGGIYILDAQYDKAIEVLENAVTLRPSASALSNLGTAYFYRREFARAAERYAAAAELAPQDSALWVNLAEARYWIPEQREQALDAARKALSYSQQELKVNPKDAGVMARVGLCHAIAGEARQSREALRQALAQAPGDTEVVVRAAQAESLIGDHDRALGLVRKALAMGVRPPTIDNDPMFDALRKDARFGQMLAQSR